MTALVGRKVTLTATGGGPTIAGMRTKSLSINNEPIDITSDDDSGFKTYLDADPAERSMEISVDGVTKDDALIAIAAGANGVSITGYDLLFTGIGTISGDLVISSMELGASYNDAVSFSATLMSSGSFTYASA